jgi:phosphate starvation-inducible PhoH-like protein
LAKPRKRNNSSQFAPDFGNPDRPTTKPLPTFNFCYQPRHERQRELGRAWSGSTFLVCLGLAGTGKTHAALGLALEDLRAGRIEKIMLSRPAVEMGEKLGFLPGNLEEKLGPWLSPFADVIGKEWKSILHKLGDHIELVPLGYARGRTVKNAVLIADESQNISAAQLKCLATRPGDNGKIILSGDEAQSDLFGRDLIRGECPLVPFVKLMSKVEGFTAIRFLPEDQQRKPFVTAAVKALKGFGK